MVATFEIEPVDAIEIAVHYSMISDRHISDIFHLFYTLKRLQDQELIDEFVQIPDKGAVTFLKMNEPRYKKINGQWKKQPPYNIPDNRLHTLIEAVDVWTAEEKQKVRDYYKGYHGNTTKNFRNI